MFFISAMDQSGCHGVCGVASRLSAASIVVSFSIVYRKN